MHRSGYGRGNPSRRGVVPHKGLSARCGSIGRAQQFGKSLDLWEAPRTRRRSHRQGEPVAAEVQMSWPAFSEQVTDCLLIHAEPSTRELDSAPIAAPVAASQCSAVARLNSRSPLRTDQRVSSLLTLSLADRHGVSRRWMLRATPSYIFQIDDICSQQLPSA